VEENYPHQEKKKGAAHSVQRPSSRAEKERRKDSRIEMRVSKGVKEKGGSIREKNVNSEAKARSPKGGEKREMKTN